MYKCHLGNNKFGYSKTGYSQKNEIMIRYYIRYVDTYMEIISILLYYEEILQCLSIKLKKKAYLINGLIKYYFVVNKDIVCCWGGQIWFWVC